MLQPFPHNSWRPQNAFEIITADVVVLLILSGDISSSSDANVCCISQVNGLSDRNWICFEYVEKIKLKRSM